jgi:hypothetical protein
VLHIVIHANVTREIDCFTQQIYSRVYLCPLWKNKFPTWSEKLTWSRLQGKNPLGYNDDRFWQKKPTSEVGKLHHKQKTLFFMNGISPMSADFRYSAFKLTCSKNALVLLFL